MSRKFATVSGFRIVLAIASLTILAGAIHAQAQQSPPATQEQPAQQTPAQQPANPQQNQEASEEEIPTRKPKAPEFTKWSYNVGGGASLTNGNTQNFVRGGGGIAAAGVARNYSKYFGFRLDFQFDNLPLRTSALQAAQTTGATSRALALTLGPIINLPVTRVWSGYIVAGGGYFHRFGKLDNSTAIPGSACSPFFTWWGNCFNAHLPLKGNFLSTSLNHFGEDFGGGIARKVHNNIEVYAEIRYFHGTGGGITTDFRPITAGIRW